MRSGPADGATPPGPPFARNNIESSHMKIGILTSGGDCPGLNAVIRGAVLKGDRVFGSQFVGFRFGWRGVVEGDFVHLDRHSVRGLSKQGGTILGSSRTNPFEGEYGGAENIASVLSRPWRLAGIRR